MVWLGIGEFLDTFYMDKYQMVTYGFIAVGLSQTLIKEIVEIFLEISRCNDDGRPCNELIRVFAEDVYIGLVTTAVIMVWKGQSACLLALLHVAVPQNYWTDYTSQDV